MPFFSEPIVIKGAGEMASGVAAMLFQAGLRQILMLDIPEPLAIRRTVCFCEALHQGSACVEGINARRVASASEVRAAWEGKDIAVAADPAWAFVARMRPQVVVDAILAKKNLGTRRDEAPLVIALGPGFTAGEDAHLVVETQRGHNLGRVYAQGRAEANTGVPGVIQGFAAERVLRAPCAGKVAACRDIGELITPKDVVMTVGGQQVFSAISGVLRGCIRPGLHVPQGCKIGDVDPRGEVAYCHTLSEKARAIGMAVLFAMLRHGNGC